MACSQCLELSFATCADFEIEVGIADGLYWAWVYDKFGNVYKSEITVVSGAFTLYQTDFPEGLFSSGMFTLHISTSETTDTEEEVTAGYTSYECILFGLYKDMSGASSSIAPSCKDNYEAMTPPSVTDDRTKGYCKGSEWQDNSPVAPSPKIVYKCTDPTANAAVWQIISFV